VMMVFGWRVRQRMFLTVCSLWNSWQTYDE
jgi:hypothetical protein